jgi:endonuclease-3 related protein
MHLQVGVIIGWHEEIPVKDLMTIYSKLYSGFGPQHWWPGDTPFEIAVGAILTQNTNWDNVERAIGNLKRRKLLSAKKMFDISEAELAQEIRPAGYFNVKARRLKAFIEFLMEAYAGSFKRMEREETQSLRLKFLGVNGIGPETADSILLYALGRPVFVIDAYTRRVLSRHGVIGYDEPYDVYQGLFHSALKPDTGLFNEYHALIVRIGKTNCRPKKPDCGNCPLDGV